MQKWQKNNHACIQKLHGYYYITQAEHIWVESFLKSYLSENHHAAAYNVVTSWTLNHVPPHEVHALLQALIGLWPVLQKLTALRHSSQLNDKTFKIGILRRCRRF